MISCYKDHDIYKASHLHHIFRILVMTTGGTIEKSYNEIDGTLKNRGSIIEKNILNYIRLPGTEIEHLGIMSKDSLDMTDSDRDIIFQNIQEQQQSKHPILVLHGTDTIVQTALHCQKKLSSIDVPIIFTGAMVPAGMRNSDAIQNMTEALLLAKIVEKGIYLVMHNRIFDINNVRKNRGAGTFEALQEDKR